MSPVPGIYKFQNLPTLANELREELAIQDYVIIYAYNGIGKTRLSRAFKDIGKTVRNDTRDTLYFNAFTEDLFVWDNVFITEDVGNLKEDDLARSKVLEKAKIAIVWFREPDMINQYTHFLLRDLIHESAHNYLAILAANVNGRSNLRTYDYSTLWNYYNQFEDPISSTDHCIMAQSTLFDEMLQTLIEVINDPFVDKKILIAGMMNGVTQSGCFVQNEKYNRTFKSFNEYLDYVGLFNHLYENSNCK